MTPSHPYRERLGLGLEVTPLGLSSAQVGLLRAGMRYGCRILLRTEAGLFPSLGLNFPTCRMRSMAGHGDLDPQRRSGH